jgi:hypothetical protein
VPRAQKRTVEWPWLEKSPGSRPGVSYLSGAGAPVTESGARVILQITKFLNNSLPWDVSKCLIWANTERSRVPRWIFATLLVLWSKLCDMLFSRLQYRARAKFERTLRRCGVVILPIKAELYQQQVAELP